MNTYNDGQFSDIGEYLEMVLSDETSAKQLNVNIDAMKK